MRLWKTNATAVATAIAASATMIRPPQLLEVLDERRLFFAWEPARPHQSVVVSSRCSVVSGRAAVSCVTDSLNSRMPGAERAPDLRHPLGAEEQERDQKQEREVRGVGQADHSCSSSIEMSVTAAPATAT